MHALLPLFLSPRRGVLPLFFFRFVCLPVCLPGHDDAKATSSDFSSEEQAASKCLSLLSEPDGRATAVQQPSIFWSLDAASPLSLVVYDF